jgi:hypothetical protein
MAIRDVLKGYFLRGFKPTANQFAALIDAFRLVSESIPVGDVEGLSNSLGSKASNADLDLLTERVVILEANSGGGGGGTGAAETIVKITDEANLFILWGIDIDPDGDGTQTYAARHGNKPIRVYGLISNGDLYSNYTPSFTYNMEGNNITSITITEIFQGTLTII